MSPTISPVSLRVIASESTSPSARIARAEIFRPSRSRTSSGERGPQ
jgi:hypothetical protein